MTLLHQVRAFGDRWQALLGEFADTWHPQAIEIAVAVDLLIEQLEEILGELLDDSTKDQEVESTLMEALA